MSSSSESTEPIAKFRALTGVDEDTAKFYLEAAGNDLEAAALNFFEERSFSESPIAASEGATSQASNPPSSGAASSKPKSDNSRFKTVSNLAGDSSSDSEEECQAFYAGGSTHSGQEVLGPPRSRNHIVADIFRSVKEHGGEVVNQEPGSSRSQTLKFSGTGYRLGQTSNDTQVVSDETTSGSGSQQVTIALKMWRQGFSVDDGPLRPYTDPASMEFLKTVGRGLIPDELLREARGNEVHLNMEDHSHEEFVQPKQKIKPFSGRGNILGGVTPTVATLMPTAPSGDPEANLEKAKTAVTVDETQPTTSVQVRLPDGSRLVGTFNHSHTIADLRTYITTARPELSTQTFRLLTTFPSKELSDADATLSAAGALNAAILLRL